MKTFKTYLDESKRGLWDNIHAKQKRIKNGSGEHMRKPGSKGAPTDAALKASQNEELIGGQKKLDKNHNGKLDGQDFAILRGKKKVKEENDLTAEEMFDLIEEMVDQLAEENNLDSETIWESLDKFTDEELVEACTCWQGYKRKPGTKPCADGSCVKEESVELDEDHLGKYRRYVQQAQNFKERGEHQNAKEAEAKAKVHGAAYKKMTGKEPTHLSSESATADAKGYKSKTGGLTQKGRDHFNSISGGHLKAPVTTPPSKLKAGSKAANRRKSFCARMSGVEGPMRKPNGEPTRKALALRKWNC